MEYSILHFMCTQQELILHTFCLFVRSILHLKCTGFWSLQHFFRCESSPLYYSAFSTLFINYISRYLCTVFSLKKERILGPFFPTHSVLFSPPLLPCLEYCYVFLIFHFWNCFCGASVPCKPCEAVMNDPLLFCDLVERFLSWARILSLFVDKIMTYCSKNGQDQE